MQDAVLYTRFSPRPTPEEAKSLEVQFERLTAYCGLASLHPVLVIRDPETSARKIPLDQRDGGKELLRVVSEGVKHVVCQRVDRLFRDASDGLKWVKKWRKQKVSLHLADQGGCSIDTTTAFGYFMFGQLVLMSETEAMMASEKTSGAMRHHQRNGRRMSDRVPYGMMRDPENPSLMVECPEEQAQILDILKLHERGVSNRGICRWLNLRGYMKRGRDWDENKDKDLVGDVITRHSQTTPVA